VKHSTTSMINMQPTKSPSQYTPGKIMSQGSSQKDVRGHHQ